MSSRPSLQSSVLPRWLEELLLSFLRSVWLGSPLPVCTLWCTRSRMRTWGSSTRTRSTSQSTFALRRLWLSATSSIQLNKSWGFSNQNLIAIKENPPLIYPKDLSMYLVISTLAIFYWYEITEISRFFLKLGDQFSHQFLLLFEAQVQLHRVTAVFTLTLIDTI